MPRIFVPPAMRPLVDGQDAVDARGATVRELIEDVELRFPGFQERLCSGGALRSGIAVSIDGRVAPLGLRQTVAAEAEVHFLPALGGG